MVRTVLVCALTPALLFLPACGEKDEPDVSGPPVVATTTTTTDETGGLPVGDGDGGVALEDVGEFQEPVFLAQPDGENALYVVEQEGRIMRVAGREPRVFLDITKLVGSEGNEQGLLSMAFDPAFERNGRFYVDYTNKAGDSRIVEYKAPARGGGRPRVSQVIYRAAQPYPNHNGGLIMFGPDGNLYTGFGDGGSGGDPERRGQDLGTPLGKILRIEPGGSGGYRVPRDNPFADERGARPEILAYGLRNPWRFSFDRETEDLWIGDVGQSEQEEIDVLPRDELESGANFGWSAFEGTARFNDDQEAPDAVDPVLTYGRDGGCSVTGGYVVRDQALESLYGRYLYADFCAGQLRSFNAEEALAGSAQDDQPLGLQVPAISSFAEDTSGRIYAISLEGPVYRLVADQS